MLQDGIIIWRFRDAPEVYQHSVGGDEDYVILVPWQNGNLRLVEVGRDIAFKLQLRSYQQVDLENGDTLLITTHS